MLKQISKKVILTPFQKFVQIESFSGLLLFSATIIALIWANSPYSETYEALRQYKLGFDTQNFQLSKPLILWINDGLMAIFFFLIGLEIKRELMIGELNSIRKASFPLFAAIGGMLAPLTAFIILNQNPETSGGWAIPMATDIAFSLAILKLLDKRVPLSLVIFLTAFAIVDDIGAVLVIAVFYSTGIKWLLLLYAAVLLVALFLLSHRGKYNKYIVFLFSITIWFLFLKSGIHPTVAGVLLAFTIPIRQKINIRTFTDELPGMVARIKASADNDVPILTREQIEEIDNLEGWTTRVQSPLQHLEHSLHSWVAYFIMPVFALFNAGVAFGGDMALDFSLVTNLIICLFVGNLVGVSLMSFLSIKLKIAELPKGIGRWQIIGTSFLAGVGFTMSIFIANLAFGDDPVFVDSAKVGILIGSFLSGLTGYIILRLSSKTETSGNYI